MTDTGRWLLDSCPVAGANRLCGEWSRHELSGGSFSQVPLKHLIMLDFFPP